MNPLLHDKFWLRQQFRARRDALPAADRESWSVVIADRVLALPQVAASERVFCYVSIGSEVDTRRLLERLVSGGKRLAVPRVIGPGMMVAQPVGGLNDLRPGPFGIPEPAAGDPGPPPDVAIVPGVAFTARGDRLGMGAGFYDRWLSTHPRTVAIGICFPPQLVDDLPTEPHDVRVARVVTA